jgi:CubicO group peptidase (beta-lactamase class C family)
LPGWQEPIERQDLYDWDKCTSLLAAQEPWWSPGTSAGYHAITQGYLIGEIVRRVTGISLGRFFASEIAEPICADFHIGLSPEDDDRVAPLIPPPVARNLLDPESLLYRVLSNPRTVMAEQTREDAWRRAEIPAANGFGNARSLAAVQSIIACGGDGPRGRLISTGGCNAVFEEQADGLDRVLDRPIRWGNGYALNGRAVQLRLNARTFFWTGGGGSIVMADLDA